MVQTAAVCKCLEHRTQTTKKQHVQWSVCESIYKLFNTGIDTQHKVKPKLDLCIPFCCMYEIILCESNKMNCTGRTIEKQEHSFIHDLHRLQLFCSIALLRRRALLLGLPRVSSLVHPCRTSSDYQNFHISINWLQEKQFLRTCSFTCTEEYIFYSKD